MEDIVVWVILAIATALSEGGPSIGGLYTLLLTIAFLLIMFVIVRPLLGLLHRYYVRRKDEHNVYFVVVCLLVLIVAAFTSEVIQIHAFFGAFIAGLIVPRSKGSNIHEFLSVRIELFCVEFFLPLYFTNSGLKTHLYSLNTGRAWYTLVALVFIVSLAKIIPVALMTRLITRKTETWSYALAVGILMNTRGIVQLVVLNVGVELNVLSPVIFAIFVLTAVILTFFTSPLLYLVYLRKRPSDTKKKNNKTPVTQSEEKSPPTIPRLHTNPMNKFVDHRSTEAYRKWRLASSPSGAM